MIFTDDAGSLTHARTWSEGQLKLTMRFAEYFYWNLNKAARCSTSGQKNNLKIIPRSKCHRISPPAATLKDDTPKISLVYEELRAWWLHAKPEKEKNVLFEQDAIWNSLEPVQASQLTMQKPAQQS